MYVVAYCYPSRHSRHRRRPSTARTVQLSSRIIFPNSAIFYRGQCDIRSGCLSWLCGDRSMFSFLLLQATTARVGMMGVMGNKGAVVVRLSLYDSTVCFVCAHMAAKRSNIQGRNADFWSILAKTAFAGDPETAWWASSFT